MTVLDDDTIIDLYLQRDETAIQYTRNKFGARLRNLSLGIVNDQQVAEECENDTYLQAWNRIPPHEPRSYFYAFLARMARHISLDFCRSRNRLKRNAFVEELSAELEQCIPGPNDLECQLDDLALGEAINAFLGMLNAQKRLIFIRRYWYLDSIAEIAKRFEISENRVKSMLFRCRNQLSSYMN